MVAENLNILYLSYDGMTDPLGQSQVLPYIIGLTQKGYQFTLISFEKQERLERGYETIKQICKDHQIEWLPLNYTKHPPVLSTVKDVLKLRKLVFNVYQKKGFDLVHCRSYITSLVGLELKRKLGVKFIFDMRGFWADERVDGNLWNLKNPLYKIVYNFFKRKEVQFLEEADYTVSLTYAGETEMKEWELLETPSPVKVIPCCVDLDHFSESNINQALKEQLKTKYALKEDTIVLSYLGSIGTWYMLEEMLHFFKQFNKKYPTAKFLFITKDAPSLILSKVEKLGLNKSKIIITPSERKEVPTYLSLSTYNIFFIKPAYSKKSSSPTKQGEVMSMGISIICNRNVGDTDEIIEKYDAGYVVENFSTSAFEETIQATSIAKKKTDILEGAKYFSLEKGLDKYLEIYKTLLD